MRGCFIHFLPLSISLKWLQPHELIVNSWGIYSFLKHLGKCRTHFKRFNVNETLSGIFGILLLLQLLWICSFSRESFISPCLLEAFTTDWVFLFDLFLHHLFSPEFHSSFQPMRVHAVICSQAGTLKACQWDINRTAWTGATFSNETFLIKTQVGTSHICMADTTGRYAAIRGFSLANVFPQMVGTGWGPNRDC